MIIRNTMPKLFAALVAILEREDEPLSQREFVPCGHKIQGDVRNMPTTCPVCRSESI
jgi:predicted Zn-ribbon and HTH transcriptional regulator